jgi:hypothetical protein
VSCKDSLNEVLASPKGSREPPTQHAHHRPDKRTDQAGRPVTQPGKVLQGGEQTPIERDAKHPGQQAEPEEYR